jgi:excisionase family DNA binding protein
MSVDDDVTAARAWRVREAAQVLGVSPRTVYRLLDDGELTRLHIGRASRVLVSSVLDYLARQQRRGPGTTTPPNPGGSGAS